MAGEAGELGESLFCPPADGEPLLGEPFEGEPEGVGDAELGDAELDFEPEGEPGDGLLGAWLPAGLGESPGGFGSVGGLDPLGGEGF